MNRNLLIVICGETGSGKSYSALTIAKLINPKFDVKKHVVFNVEQFMKILNSGKLRKGYVIIWDEAGVGVPAKEWYTISNKAIGYVMQTFRHMNLCVIFTTPTFEYIDKTIRVLFHVLIETIRIDYENEVVKCKVKQNKYNPTFGKPYTQYYWVNGAKQTVVNIRKPTKDLVNDYEEVKKEFSELLRADVEADILLAKRKEKHKRLTDADIMKRIKDEQIPLEVYLLQFKFNIGKDRAYRIVNNYKKFSPSL